MNCGNCGAFLQPGATSCPSCGSPVIAKPDAAYGQPMQQPYGAPQGQPYQQAPYGAPQGQPYQQAPYGAPQGQPYQQAPYGQPYMGGPQSPYDIAAMRGQGMKWFKFIVNFALIAGAVLNFIGAIYYATGMVWSTAGAVYGTDGSWVKQLMYSSFPGLPVADIIYGVICVVAGILAIKSRQKLAAFKVDGPAYFLKMMIITGVLSVVGCLIYVVMLGSEAGASFMSTIVGTIIGTVIWYLIHKTYLGNRADLFTNP